MAMAGAAWADQPSVGLPTYGGNGCPAGSASAALSPDASSLSVIYDAFSAEAGGTSGTRMDRKSCKMQIPVHVPAGMRVAITQIDYRGFLSLPNRAYSQFTVQYAAVGSEGPRFMRRFVGPFNDNFETTNKLKKQDVKFSGCGQSVAINVDTSIVVQSNGTNEQTLGTVDSTDLRGGAGLTYQLQWEQCR